MTIRLGKEQHPHLHPSDATTTTTSRDYYSPRVIGIVILICCVTFFVSVGFFAENTAETVDLGEIWVKVDDRTVPVGAAGTTATPSTATSQNNDNSTTTSTTKDEPPNNNDDNNNNNNNNMDTCRESYRHAVQEKFKGDLFNRTALIDLASAAKERLLDQLREDYGEYTEAIFLTEETAFVTHTPELQTSMDRLKRKFLIKILTVQTTLLEDEVQYCSTTHSSQDETTKHHRQLVNDEILIEKDSLARYVWATGGHSAAAGHGNLYNESYTAYMTRDVQPIFAAIGIEWEGRNYAMGGTASSPELSMCWPQIFGEDVDFFSWDYGMTDGNYPQRMMHYGFRGGISEGHPAFMGLRIGGRAKGSRDKALLELEEMGFPIFRGSDEAYNVRNQAVPDSAALTEEQIQELPEYIRNLKCGEQIEKGEPYCRAEKYTSWGCPKRSKQVNWHPGYKSHAMDGHALALFLVNTLLETLSDLVGHQESDPNVLLETLIQEEKEAFQTILESELPPSTNSIWFPSGDVAANGAAPFDVESVWKGPSICRTARLPSQSRYNGYATNSDKVGGYTILGQEEYDLGIPIKEANLPEAMNGTAKLTFEPGGREREACNAVLKPDYKDFFYTRGVHGETKLTIPNDREKAAYSYTAMQPNLKGYIFLCLVPCDWGKCAAGEMRYTDYETGLFEVTVNGQRVSNLTHIGFDVTILQGDTRNNTQWQPNANGDFEIGLSVKDPNSYLRISSIIIF